MIKTIENCNKCIFGLEGPSCKNINCSECHMNIPDHLGCKCGTIMYNEDCPYYQEAEEEVDDD